MVHSHATLTSQENVANVVHVPCMLQTKKIGDYTTCAFVPKRCVCKVQCACDLVHVNLVSTQHATRHENGAYTMLAEFESTRDARGAKLVVSHSSYFATIVHSISQTLRTAITR